MMPIFAILVAAFLARSAEGTAVCIEQQFEVRKLPGALFGAEVIGLDLETITDDTFQLVDHHLLANKILVFRNQSHLSIEGQRAFSRRFGPLQVHIESTSHLDGYADVNVISNEQRQDGAPQGLYGTHVETFHADLSWSDIPSKCTMLKSVIRPESGGETHFSDSGAAYAALSVADQQRVLGLWGQYTYLKHREGMAQEVDNEDASLSLRRGSVHPLISMHPVTGQRAILANPSHLIRVLNVPQNESEAVMKLLFDQIRDSRFHYVHSWSDGDLVVWDNRAVQHRASPAPSTTRRLVRTTTLQEQFPRPEWNPLYVPPRPPCSHHEDL